MSSVIMDYGALEYVRLNENAVIVSQSVFAKSSQKKFVESVLNKEGFVYYERRVGLRYVSVFVCESKEKLVAVRQAIQESVGTENGRVRISAMHEEAIEWAGHYFGTNIRLKRLRYILKYYIYRKERRDNGERALYLFGIRVFGYRISKRYWSSLARRREFLTQSSQRF